MLASRCWLRCTSTSAAGRRGKHSRAKGHRRARRVFLETVSEKKRMSGIARRSWGSEPAYPDGASEKDFRIKTGQNRLSRKGKKCEPPITERGFAGIDELRGVPVTGVVATWSIWDDTLEQGPVFWSLVGTACGILRCRMAPLLVRRWIPLVFRCYESGNDLCRRSFWASFVVTLPVIEPVYVSGVKERRVPWWISLSSWS